MSAASDNAAETPWRLRGGGPVCADPAAPAPDTRRCRTLPLRPSLLPGAGGGVSVPCSSFTCAHPTCHEGRGVTGCACLFHLADVAVTLPPHIHM